MPIAVAFHELLAGVLMAPFAVLLLIGLVEVVEWFFKGGGWILFAIPAALYGVVWALIEIGVLEGW